MWLVVTEENNFKEKQSWKFSNFWTTVNFLRNEIKKKLLPTAQTVEAAELVQDGANPINSLRKTILPNNGSKSNFQFSPFRVEIFRSKTTNRQ